MLFGIFVGIPLFLLVTDGLLVLSRVALVLNWHGRISDPQDYFSSELAVTHPLPEERWQGEGNRRRSFVHLDHGHITTQTQFQSFWFSLQVHAGVGGVLAEPSHFELRPVCAA